MKHQIQTIAVGVMATLAMAAGPASAASFTYKAILNDISGLGGSGMAVLVFDDMANTLNVKVTGSGFAPDMVHLQHIHGLFNADGTAADSQSPTMADDADMDGVVELLEGFPNYGTILLSLFDEDDSNSFPTAPGGVIDFEHTYDLSTTMAFNPDKNLNGTQDDPVFAADLFPLDFREIVIHGAFLPAGVGGLGNEGTTDPSLIPAGYSLTVPVAAGEIFAAPTVPLPAAGWMLIAGIGGLTALRRARR